MSAITMPEAPSAAKSLQAAYARSAAGDDGDLALQPATHSAPPRAIT
jgi:hypothetical protein